MLFEEEKKGEIDREGGLKGEQQEEEEGRNRRRKEGKGIRAIETLSKLQKCFFH